MSRVIGRLRNSVRRFEAVTLLAFGLACGCNGSGGDRANAGPGEGGAGGAGGEGGSGPQCDAVNPGLAALKLLTREQYNNTVRDLLGDDSSPADRFPPEPILAGFDNNAELHRANALLVERYLDAAEAVATLATETRLSEIAPCATDGVPEECLGAFIEIFGLRCFRRPLTPTEIEIFMALARQAPNAEYKVAVSLVLQAFLQSPQFLHRTEVEAPSSAEDGAVLLDAYELASRLSYFLWESTPDEELLQAAAANELASAAEVEAQVRRMLDSPKAHDAVSNFHRQWAMLDGFRDVVRTVPESTPELLPAAWRESLRLFLDSVFWNDGTLGAVFSSPAVFVNGTLAPLYGVPGPADPNSFEPATLPDGRHGLLAQPALMALLALPEQSSPIRRGVFLREHILCDDIPSPPPDVDPTPPDPDPNLTTRERFKVHTANDACRGCHSLIDPVGFGFEGFDHAGRFRDTENGKPVDVSGEMVAAPDASLEGPFSGVNELSDKIASSPAAQDCWATNWYRYAMGRVELPSDVCVLDQIKESFRTSGGDLKELLVTIALSDSFRYRPAFGGAP